MYDLFGEIPKKPQKEQATSFHTNTENKEDWYTPPEMISVLGQFDLDPCSPIIRPYDTALSHYNKLQNGLLLPWQGRVWLNPPYGRELIKWLHKMSLHGNGTALIFARTETRAFQNFIFPHAESMLFINGRINFHLENGQKAKDHANAPSVLIGYDEYNSQMIEQSGIKGHHIYLRPRMFVVSMTMNNDKSWRIVVGEVLEEFGQEATLTEIYHAVVRHAPEKITKNKHYEAKIRQTLQLHFNRISKGTYTFN